jgi:hypothetical protein
MTTATSRVFAPTAMDRMLLHLSLSLAHLAETRMRRRLVARRHAAYRRAAVNGHRDIAASVHVGLMPR